jgi:hypothetical protein
MTLVTLTKTRWRNHALLRCKRERSWDKETGPLTLVFASCCAPCLANPLSKGDKLSLIYWQ